MDRWPVIGAAMILVGVVILVLLRDFIWHVLVTLLELLGVAIGIVLVLGGIAALVFGSRWSKMRKWGWGPPPETA